MKSNSITKWRVALILVAISLCLAMAITRPWQSAQALHTANGVAAPVALVNAASYDAAVAPGSIAALFGAGMATQTAIASTLPLPKTLGGVTVKIGGIDAPLFFVSPNQINLQVPGGVAPGIAAIQVFNTGNATAIGDGTATVADSAPGIFTLDVSGKNQAVAQNSDLSRNADFDKLPGARPEASGNVVVIYATGIGNTNPLVADGVAAPASPLAQAVGTTIVTIGGVPAEVQFSGLVPGFVGLWQMNVVLPGNLPTNLATPFTVALKGKTSLTTTLAVVNKNEYGTVSGTVLDAVTGAALPGASITLQPTAAGNTRTAMTDTLGKFAIYVINPGNYNLSAAAGGFITVTESSTITGGQSKIANFALTAPLTAGQYRIIVTWQNSLDLDAHMTGPGTGNSRFHVWWLEPTDLLTPTTTMLDVDGASPGPETITFTPSTTGIYRLSIHNYTDRDSNGSNGIAQSGVIVRVYRGNNQLLVFTPPNSGGTLWKVFELNNGQLNTINSMTDEPDSFNIKNSF
ncbi:MAG: carboxypeptidase regulatory-like domain-containing protein [Blastocatellales bacterium]